MTWARPRNLLAYWSPMIGVVVAFVGLLVIYAWAFDVPWLTTLGQGLAAMEPNAALSFVLAGSALALNSKFFAPNKFRRVQFVLIGVMLTIIALTLLEILFSINIGIDDMLPVAPNLREAAGRMSEVTAFQFLLVGIALNLLLTYQRRPTTIAGSMVTATLLISIFALLAYVLESKLLYQMQPFQSMALHSAACFFVLSIGIIGVVVAANWKSYGAIDSRILKMGVKLWLAAVLIELFGAYFVLRISTGNDVVLFTLLVFKFVIMAILFAAVIAAGVILMSIDSHAREELRQRLIENEQLFRITFQNARQGIEVIRADGRRVDINRRACEIFDRTRDELLNENIWSSTKDVDIEKGRLELARLAGGEIDSYEREKRIVRGDGEEHWVKVIAVPGAVSKDHVKTFVVVIDDIQKAKDAEQARDLLMGEINHRVKNTLAVIQGMIGKLKMTNVSAEDMANSLTMRIANLGASYDLLNRKDWNEPKLGEIFEEALRAGFDVYRDRFASSFVPAKVNSQAAIYLGMIFYELMTNSVKYGALGSDKGRVTIVSASEKRDCGQLWTTVTWTEAGGPKVEAPKAEGFGSFVLEKGVSFGLRGTCKIDFKETGLHVTWQFPSSAAD